ALLADPVTEAARIGALPTKPAAQVVEVHPLPGVMDPVAQSVEQAMQELLDLREPARVSTGWRYDLEGATAEQAKTLANRLLANPVIQRVYTEPYHPREFASAAAHAGEVRSVPLIKLTDAELEKLSREAHLFLSLEEMKAIQAEYRRIG